MVITSPLSGFQWSDGLTSLDFTSWRTGEPTLGQGTTFKHFNTVHYNIMNDSFYNFAKQLSMILINKRDTFLVWQCNNN